MCSIMVFRPSKEEFNDFKKYISFMEAQGASKAGIAKVIPPNDWIPRKNGYDDLMNTVVIKKPIRQEVQGSDGVFEQIITLEDSMTVTDYKAMANLKQFKTPNHQNYNELEKEFWKTVNNNVIPLYGADIADSAMDEDVSAWNMRKLGTVLDIMNEDYGKANIAEGINTSYLYFGMWKTFFVWHTEDMDLYSVNYLHTGSPKTWYSVPTQYGRQFEQLLTKLYKDDAKYCKAFFRHKICVVSPEVLKSNGIPCNKITQEPGELIVTFPLGYHSGFNHGFNLAEAVNFASERWIEFGKRVTQCFCLNTSVVQFSMDAFVKRYQAELYITWKKGLDIGPHPEFPEEISAANKPTIYDIQCNKNNRKRANKGKKPKLARGRPRKQKSKRVKITELAETVTASLPNSNGDNENVEKVDEITQQVQEESYDLNVPISSAFQASDTTQLSINGTVTESNLSIALPTITLSENLQSVGQVIATFKTTANFLPESPNKLETDLNS